MSQPIPSMFACLGLLLVACTGKDTGDTDDDGDGGPSDGPLEYSPIVQYVNFQFQGRPVVGYLPENVKGVVWLFHGRNGSVGYANKIETIATTNLLVEEGIGFVCSQSLDQGPENNWDKTDPYTDSVDARFMLDLYAFLLESDLLGGTLDLDTPHYTLGFSGGGDMSGYYAKALLAEGHDVRAVASHSAGGHVGFGVPLPVIFILPENDDTGRSTAEGSVEEREAQGLATPIYEPPEIAPLPPDFWTRNPSVSTGASQKVFDEMVRLGLIDEGGTRLVEIEDAEAALTQWEKDADLASPTLRTEETQVGWAMHRMNGYYAHKVRDFFLDYL